MAEYQAVFKRCEKKYLLEKQQYMKLMEAIGGRFAIDEYGRHTICNIYFDSETDELIRASIEKPAYKEKFRLRSYGIPSGQDTVFMEIKKKAGGIVYKRRMPIKLADAQAYLYCGQRPLCRGQIFNEIDWMVKRYSLRPAAFIAYDRIAMYGLCSPDLRMTFDTNITGRDTALSLEKGVFGQKLLDAGKILMEVKIPDAVPIWMSRLFSELGIFPVSFSKYGTYYKYKLAAGKAQTGGKYCA